VFVRFFKEFAKFSSSSHYGMREHKIDKKTMASVEMVPNDSSDDCSGIERVDIKEEHKGEECSLMIPRTKISRR
jgi:hypothetical protein